MPLPSTLLENKPSDAVGYHLVVMGPELFHSVPLPEAGTLAIGRADTADLRLSDPLASRLHARLHVETGGRFFVEDLGSVNKTRIREAPLAPGERVAVVPGEAITIGSTVLMIQRNCQVSRPRRVWPHGYFEARLEEECARSATTRDPFAVLRVRLPLRVAVGDLVGVLAPALRLPDMLASYSPNEYEILLASTPPDLARAIADDLGARLKEAGWKGQVGLACYPREGRTPETLIAAASARVRPEAPQRGARSAPTPIMQDAAMKKLLELAERAAAGMISILIVGETGVGKEVMAESVHRLSPRWNGPFLCINCATLSENLLESELFGHERGAFTGATESKPGLLETAPGGTVFLDEIGEMPMGLQAKLLRVLETRQVTRVGSLKPRPIDVRFLAATNRDLPVEVAQGRFRKDLYFRLNGVTLHVPPLRERRSEIAPLAAAFIAEQARLLGLRSEPALDPEALALLERHGWPGNVRELRNVIERALLLSSGDEIRVEHLPQETMDTMDTADDALGGSAAPPAVSSVTVLSTSAQPGAQTERDRILAALEACVWNQTRAARALKISRSALIEKMDKLGLPRPRKGA